MAGCERNEVPHWPEPRERPDGRADSDQCKMYVAALRIADDFGCHTIGIQYQQGLKDMAPASEKNLVETTWIARP